MQESTGRENKKEPDSEATSKETLSDLEKNEETGSSSSEVDPGPSPDGPFDESAEDKRRRADVGERMMDEG